MASSDQAFGTSTFSCLKMTLPASSVISAVRRSHSNWSYGEVFGSLKTRSMLSVFLAPEASFLGLRVAVTVEDRRRACCGLAAETGSLTSIMVSPLDNILLPGSADLPATEKPAGFIQICLLSSIWASRGGPGKPH